MNYLFRSGTIAFVTTLALNLLSTTFVSAANNQRPDDKCQPNCEAVVSEQTVNLSWTAPTTRTDGDPITLSDLEGYRIYYGTASDNLTPLVDLDDSSITSYSVTELSPGLYYFSVTAYDYDGLESTYSEIVSKEVL